MSPLSINRTGVRESAEFLGLPLHLRKPKSPTAALRVAGLSDREVATTRLACSWLLAYPDAALLDRLDGLAAAVAELPDGVRSPLEEFLTHLDGTPIGTAPSVP